MAKNAGSRKVTVDPDRITFGVEIECTLPIRYVRERRIEIGRYHHGIQLPAPFPTGWTAQSDSSLYADFGTTALEIVSPVLSGLEGLQQVLDVFRFLNEAGAKVNDSCGFHVHIGAVSVLGRRVDNEGLKVRWVRRMLHLMSQHEAALFAITGRPSRYDNVFCETIKGKWSYHGAGVLETTSDLATIARRAQRHSDRYYTLNLCNLFGSKRTVEFRLFGATLDGVQALGYVVTAMGIAHRAAECGTVAEFDAEQAPLTSDTWQAPVQELHRVFAGYGWPTGAKARWSKAIRTVQRESAQAFAEARG
jgi:hypothetical protein